MTVKSIHIYICFTVILAGVVAGIYYYRITPDSSLPYPESSYIKTITWHANTHQMGADGSDLFPVTWAADNQIFTAWGDGFGFSTTEGKKSFGVSVIEGYPPGLSFSDVFFGPSRQGNGKIIDLIAVKDTLYATFNTQNGKWPNITYRFLKSIDSGRTWETFSWQWRSGNGSFEPRRFLQGGKGNRHPLDTYIYVYGRKVNESNAFYMARVPWNKIELENSYQFFNGTDKNAKPVWSSTAESMRPVFVDNNMREFKLNSFCVQYLSALERYIAVVSHGDAGQIGIFDGPAPWGPWTTVAYYEEWLEMNGGVFLSMSFPAKWIADSGKTLWAVFSVHGHPEPATYHDKFNLMKATLITD